MPEYKLTYFNGRAKAEIIRFLFALAEVPYEDVRIEIDDWPKRKPELDLPFGQVPTLSIDGTVYAQAIPIARHLAEQFGFAGKTDLEKLRVDMIAHYVEDFLNAVYRIFKEPDEKKKIELRTKFENEDVKTFLSNFEKILKQNKNGDEFFVGDSITWADLAVYHQLNYLEVMIDIAVTSYLGPHPKLSALLTRVQNVPQIARWLDQRPKTRY